MKIQTPVTQANFSILLACFIMATIAWGTVFYGHSVYLDAFTRLGSWKTQQITTAILIFWFSSLPGTLSIGYLIDSKGPCSMIILGALFIGLALIGLGQARELWQIFLCYALMGFAYPAIGAAGISATLAPHFSKNFGLALGIALTGASLGGALIPFCIIFFIGAVGFKTTTLVLGLSVFVILFCLSILFKYKTPKSVAKQAANIEDQHFQFDILRKAIFWRIAIAAALGLGGQVGFLAHQIPIIADKVDQLSAAFTVSVVAISAATGRILIAFASRYISVNKLAAASYFIQGTGIAYIIFAETFSMIVVACSIAGFVVGGIVMLPPMLIRNAFGSFSYGKNYAMANVVLYIFAGIGPWLVGVAHGSTNSYTLGLSGLVVSQIIAAIMISTPTALTKTSL